jgi:hypothetical protein
MKRRSLIDIEAPDQTYRIDRLIKSLAANGVCLASVREARNAIDIAGAQAIELARAELLDWPRQLHSAAHLLARLAELNGIIARISSIDPEFAAAEAADEANVAELDELRRPKAAFLFSLAEIMEIQTDLANVGRKVEAFLHRYNKQPHGPGPSNVDPLASRWLDAGAIAWHALTHAWPDRKSRRHFVRFLAAGWEDLGFPSEDAKGDARVLETWFSERLSKRNLLTKNSLSNSRI